MTNPIGRRLGRLETEVEKRSDARTAENGSVRTCSLNKSAKVVLVQFAKTAIRCAKNP
jgi:hypothetical protein